MNESFEFDQTEHLKEARKSAARSNLARGLDRAIEVLTVYERTELNRKQKAALLNISSKSLDVIVYRARLRIKRELESAVDHTA